ncbi:MAG: hypothetical protein DRN81_02385 [Thermoproteota archaeon]|nr:MAG: hypothetical protein DRN81_02385 [Candidatus Korarchaeota archaeon]
MARNEEKLNKINELIAIYVFNWHIHEGAWFDDAAHYKEEACDWDPATDIRDAWMVVDKFEFFGFNKSYMGERRDILYYASFMLDPGKWTTGETECLAICLAALTAKGINIEGLRI